MPRSMVRLEAGNIFFFSHFTHINQGTPNKDRAVRAAGGVSLGTDANISPRGAARVGYFARRGQPNISVAMFKARGVRGMSRWSHIICKH
jgi:hypothetical protein